MSAKANPQLVRALRTLALTDAVAWTVGMAALWAVCG